MEFSGKAIGYVRVSTEGQAKEGVSLENQKQRIIDYCSFRKFDLVQVIEDAGFSGGTNRYREGFINLLNKIDEQAADILIIYSLERLSRDMLTLLCLERYLSEYHVQLHTIEGQTDTSTPEGFLSFAMRAFFSEMERRQISHRTKKAMEFKKAEGKVIGNIPYGYQREGKNLIPNDSEQAVLEIANSMHAEGKRLKDIVFKINNAGLRNRNGSEWTSSQIRNIISNYRGKFSKSKTKTTAIIRRLIETI